MLQSFIHVYNKIRCYNQIILNHNHCSVLLNDLTHTLNNRFCQAAIFFRKHHMDFFESSPRFITVQIIVYFQNLILIFFSFITICKNE